MSKYYDKELPVTVHVTYGGMHSGKTYREFEKLKARIKQLEEHNKELVETNYDLAIKKTKLEEENKKLEEELKFEKSICSNQAQRIKEAIEYIGNGNIGIPKRTREKFIKKLKGEELGWNNVND